MEDTEIMVDNTTQTIDLSLAAYQESDYNCDESVSCDSECNNESIALCINGLCLCYENETAIEDITFDIPKNKITAIVGPSGCGKTSFLCCLNRLTDMYEKCKVDGNISIGKSRKCIFEYEGRELRRRIGMVMQKPTPFPFSIRKNLEMPLRQHGVKDNSVIEEKINTVLTEVSLLEEIKGKLHKNALSLSGGQQQRLCIARTLILEPEIILMDEPCNALDPRSALKIEELIVKLKKDYTLIVVTHDLKQAQRIADYLAVFSRVDGKGRLIEHGLANTIFKSPKHESTASYLAYAT